MADLQIGDIVPFRYTDLADEDRCPECGHPDGLVRAHSSTHWAALECEKESCKKHIEWVRKPENQNKEKRNRPAREIRPEVNICEICLREEEILPAGETLEGHHIEPKSEGGSDDPENILIVCTPCHKWIEHRRIYIGGHIARQVRGLQKPAHAH